MDCAALDNISPAQLHLKIQGYNRRQRDFVETLRIHAFISVSPYIDSKKPIKLHELWPLPWDSEKTAKKKQTTEKNLKKARELWKRIDASKNAK